MTDAQERHDLLASLNTHRHFLISATEGLTDDQARRRTTVSALTIGGLIKHVAGTEQKWAQFVVEGPGAFELDFNDPAVAAAWQGQFVLGPDETLQGALAHYRQVTEATNWLVETVDLDLSWPLPEAPWFTPGNRTARRTFLHIVGETAQHAGHADIIRESLDGKLSMG